MPDSSKIHTPALPANPRTVVDFLTGCPAAAATQRCRVTAIDHHHAGASYPKPGESVVVRAALGRPTGEPFHPTDRAAVEAALRGLPSHGWTQGMFGRRDRCLLVLSQLAGVPYRHLAAFTAGDITIADGAATMRSPTGEWTLPPGDDDVVLCGPCAVVRWLKILDLAVTQLSTRTIAGALKRTKAVDHRSPHVCQTGPVLGAATRAVPLLPPIDQWGYEPFSLQSLTPHSLSRRTRDLLAGDLGAHRDLPVDSDQEPETTPAPTTRPGATTPRAVYGAAEAAAAMNRRRRELEQLAGITDVLTDVERRADELNRRAAELIEDWL